MVPYNNFLIFMTPTLKFLKCHLLIIIKLIIVQDVITDSQKKKGTIALFVGLMQELHRVRETKIEKVYGSKILKSILLR